MRPTRDKWALGLAKLTAERSTCLRRSVGCVLLNSRGWVLATGYNGVAAGLPHCNELTITMPGKEDTAGRWRSAGSAVKGYHHACPGADSPSGTNLDCCQAIHAEQNALLQCRDIRDIQTCYVTTSPCITCTKLLMNTSCVAIYFLEEYAHNQAAKELWLNSSTREIRRTWELIKL